MLFSVSYTKPDRKGKRRLLVEEEDVSLSARQYKTALI